MLVFTNSSDFQAAVSDYGYCSQKIDFESSLPATEYPYGSTIKDLRFLYDLPLDLIVDDTFDAASGNNYLGVSGDNAFLSGDMLDLHFIQTIYAIGLHFLCSPGDVRYGDFELQVANMKGINSSNPDMLLSDGTEAFFIGIVDTDINSGFSIATLSNLIQAEYEFHIDDIIYGTETSFDADEDGDCDVDGMDLCLFASSPFTGDDLYDFATQFGNM